MISPKEAALRLKGSNQGLAIKECGFYKRHAYLFVATETGERVDYNDPYYLVDANTGRVSEFDPLTDLLAFQDALVNHPMNWR